MKKKTRSVLLAVAMVSVLAAGCSGASGQTASSGAATEAAADKTTAESTAESSKETEESKEQAAGGTFIYIRAASTTSLDLHREITSNNAFAIDKVFEPLVTFDQEGNITDWLAESHDISEDGLVYTFVLRDGLKFSDGTDVTAEDVKFSLDRHLEVGGSLPISADVVSVEAQDQKTAVITLGTPFGPFLSELANFTNGIIPRDFGGKTEEEFFQNPVGTGPFVVESWDPAGDITFVKNEYYWQEGKPYLDKLVYRIVDDENQAMNQLIAGEVNGIESVSFGSVENLANNPDTRIETSGSWQVEELFFNTLDEHFSDVHVRRAIALAIDRQALTQALTFGYGETANSIVPSSLKFNHNDTVKALSGDVEAARAELAQSAYPDGFDTTISIASGNNTRMQEAQIIQAAAAQIGINIQINAQEIATFREDFRNYNFDMMINGATADYPDADSIFHFQVDPEGFSKCYWTNYNNEEATQLMHAGQQASTDEERDEIYRQLQQILADDVPYIPLYYPDVVIGLGQNVEGIEVLPNGSVRFENVTIAE